MHSLTQNQYHGPPATLPSLPRNPRTNLLLYAPKNLAACATCSSLKLAMKKYEWS